MSERVFLITGATGFIGANLCRRLVGEGVRPHVLIKPSSLRWRLEDILDRVEVHEADIRDAEAVTAVVESVRPGVIYHLATHGAYHYQDDCETILLVNVFGLWNLLNACNRVGYELFVNTGSSSEYGRKQFAMRETDVLNPNSFYAVAKSAQSLLCAHCANTDGLPLVTVRPFSVYGPYEEPGRLIPNLMMAAVEGKRLDMASPATARDFVYVDDVVDLYLAVDELSKLGGEIVNIGTGVQTSLSRIVETCEKVGGKPLDVHWDSMEARVWDSDSWVADLSKLRRMTGFTPGTTLEEGLAKCLPWFRDHAHFYGGKAPGPC